MSEHGGLCPVLTALFCYRPGQTVCPAALLGRAIQAANFSLLAVTRLAGNHTNPRYSRVALSKKAVKGAVFTLTTTKNPEQQAMMNPHSTARKLGP